jgi:hypothetical protein
MAWEVSSLPIDLEAPWKVSSKVMCTQGFFPKRRQHWQEIENSVFGISVFWKKDEVHSSHNIRGIYTNIKTDNQQRHRSQVKPRPTKAIKAFTKKLARSSQLAASVYCLLIPSHLILSRPSP